MAISNFLKTKQHSTIVIWEVKETLKELEDLSKKELLESVSYTKLKTEKRKKEWLVTRLIIEKVFEGKEVSILYNSDRKPFLSNNVNISISHSGNFVTVMLNNSEAVGIDIQVLKPNILKGADFFLLPKEIQEIGEEEKLNKLHVYWCAKEALFKYAGEYNLNLFSDFYIHPFNINKGKIIGEVISTKEKVDLKFEFNANYYLTYTTKTIN